MISRRVRCRVAREGAPAGGRKGGNRLARTGTMIIPVRTHARSSDGGGYWAKILIHAEQIRRIVLGLDRDQPIIVVTIRGLHAFLALLHHEVDVGAAS